MATTVCASGGFEAPRQPHVHEVQQMEGGHSCEDPSNKMQQEEKEDSHAPVDNDSTEQQVEILLQSMTILVNLAMMDSTTYQQSLQHSDSQVCQLQKSLDTLQSRWRLEDTPAVQLSTLIHGFHGTIYNLQQDAEEQTLLYEQLQQRAHDAQQRTTKLEHALLKLHGKNEKLVTKIKQRQTEKRSLVRHVQGYAQQVKDFQKEQQQLEERNVAYQLQAHEQFLQQQQNGSGLRRRCFSHDIPLTSSSSNNLSHPTRPRGLSSDSNFSDMDALLDFGSSSHSRTGGELPAAIQDVDHVLRQCMSNSQSAADDQSSIASLVTDGGIATVRLDSHHSSPPRTPKREVLTGNNHSMSSLFSSPWQHSKYNHKDQPAVREITFSDASVIGLQFEKVEEADEETTSNSHSIHLDMRMLHKSPQQPKQKGLLNHAIIENGEPPSLPLKHQQDDTTTSNDHGNGKHFWNKVFGGNKGNHDEDAVTEHQQNDVTKPESNNNIFVVSGFQGFQDDQHEQRPELGTTLVSINGAPVSGAWSLGDLQRELARAAAAESTPPQRHLDSSSSSTVIPEETSKELREDSEAVEPTSTTCITLGFRNDPLAKHVRERLEKAAGVNPTAEHGRGVDPSFGSSLRSGSSSRFSFLKLQSPGRALKENLPHNNNNNSESTTTTSSEAPAPSSPQKRASTPKGKLNMISSKLPGFLQGSTRCHDDDDDQGGGGETKAATTPKSKAKGVRPFLADADGPSLREDHTEGIGAGHNRKPSSSKLLGFLSSSQILMRDNSVSHRGNSGSSTEAGADAVAADTNAAPETTSTGTSSTGNDELLVKGSDSDNASHSFESKTRCSKDTLGTASESEDGETVESDEDGGDPTTTEEVEHEDKDHQHPIEGYSTRGGGDNFLRMFTSPFTR